MEELARVNISVILFCLVSSLDEDEVLLDLDFKVLFLVVFHVDYDLEFLVVSDDPGADVGETGEETPEGCEEVAEEREAEPWCVVDVDVGDGGDWFGDGSVCGGDRGDRCEHGGDR